MTSPAYLARSDYSLTTGILTTGCISKTCPESCSEAAINYYRAPPLAFLVYFACLVMNSELVSTNHFLTIILAAVRIDMCCLSPISHVTIIHHPKNHRRKLSPKTYSCCWEYFWFVSFNIGSRWIHTDFKIVHKQYLMISPNLFLDFPYCLLACVLKIPPWGWLQTSFQSYVRILTFPIHYHLAKGSDRASTHCLTCWYDRCDQYKYLKKALDAGCW